MIEMPNTINSKESRLPICYKKYEAFKYVFATMQMLNIRTRQFL